MCPARGRAILHSMKRDVDEAAERKSGAIEIQLWLEGSMPAGVATGPGGGTRDFTGWVGLMSAVDAVAGNDGNQTIGEDK
jgi:hypothetical protein